MEDISDEESSSFQEIEVDTSLREEMGYEDISIPEDIEDQDTSSSEEDPASDIEDESGVMVEDRRPMVISTLRINSFKSFSQELFLENLGPGLHIIVGQNGSGKSNILSAINLVVSEDLAGLHERERRELISSYSNVNQRAEFGVLFDNALQGFPGPAEIQISITVGKNSSKLLVNGVVPEPGFKTLSLFNLINPLYYIQQGEIAGFVMLTDVEHLSLIKSITSYTIWEEMRKTLVSEMHMYGDRKKNLEESLDQLKEELDIHKKELEQVEVYESRKKEIEVLNYCITERNFRKDAAKLDNLLQTVQEAKSSAEGIHKEVCTLEKDIGDRKSELGDVTRSMTDHEHHRTLLLGNINRSTKLKQTLENELEEIQGQKAQLEAGDGDSLDVIGDLNQLENTIKASYKKVLDSRTEENSAFSTVAKLQAEIQFLKEKMSRGDVGKNPEFGPEKRAELERLIDELQLTRNKKMEADDACNELEDYVNAAIGKVKQGWDFLQGNRNAGEDLKIELRSLQAKRSQLNAKQVKIWDEKAKNQRKVTELREKMDEVNCVFKLVGGKLYQSVGFVGKVISDFHRSQDREDRLAAENYYGMLLENITGVGEEFRTALEVAAGKKMFFHVIKTRASGMRILKEYNRRKYPGELVFLSEDTILKPPLIPQEVLTRTRAEALRNHVQYSFTGEKSVHYTVGNFLVVRDIKDVRVDKAERYTYVSVDGDILKSNGPITGGYRDPSKSIVAAQAQKVKLRLDLEALEKGSEKSLEDEGRVQLELENINQKIDDLKLNLNKNYDQTEELRVKHGQLILEITTAENAQAGASGRVTKFFQTTELLKALIHHAEEDLITDFKGPTPSPQNLEDQKKELLAAKEKYRLENLKLKKIGRELLDMKLKRRALLSRLGGDSNIMDVRGLPRIVARINSAGKEIQNLSKTMAGLNETLKKLEGQQAKEKSRARALEVEIEKLKVNLSDKSLFLGTATKHLQTVWLAANALGERQTHQAGLLAHYSNEAGIDDAMVEENFPQFLGKGTTVLFAMIEELMKEHTKGPPMNWRAADSIEELETKTKETASSLEIAQQEFDDSIDSLGQSDEIAPRAFVWILKSIMYSFRVIYKEILEASGLADRDGSANLVLYSQNREFGYDTNVREWGDETFIGAKLGIITRHGQRHDMRTLSGGQRSVLALAFILAVQKFSPTRLFLFDEIDQALDKEYTAGVVKVLKRFCEEEGAQFFCTTFNKSFVKEGDKVFHVTHTGTTSMVAEIGIEEACQLPFLGTNQQQMSGIPAASQSTSDGSTATGLTQD